MARFPNHSSITWPHGKRFAFTIFDDPDCQTIENGRPVYDFLAERGFRTTKAVWPLAASGYGRQEGTTCADPDYRTWVGRLKEQGFEIALHNVTYHTASRSETIRGLDRFAELFGDYPKAMANHTGCREGIYWGVNRLTGFHRTIYNILHRYKNRDISQGHIEGSPLFWGDVCRQKIKYVRNFVFRDVNTLWACPSMPYHDADRPYVNYWFAAAEGPDVRTFCATLSESSQDRLAAEGGACIMYTHLGIGFSHAGQLDRRFRFLLERLSRMNGWFVPVSALLDYLLDAWGPHEISNRERSRLERRWLWEKAWGGPS
jgi:hypothetical protein